MNGTVLVVDDYAPSRDALASLLGDAAYAVRPSADAAQALDALARETIDLVLLDVGLPKVSGLDLLSQIRQTRAPLELPIIMVTATGESEAVVEALRRGANDYVTKPVDFAVLLARVRTQLELCRLARLKDEFLRIASHDLKNPLTVILFGADALLDDFPVGAAMTDAGRKGLGAIIEGARRMQRIIGDFLDLGALRDGKLVLQPGDVDVRELLQRSLASHRAYASAKAIALELVDGAAPPSLRADATRLQQIIDNLVSNAVKFTPRGGAVELELFDGEASLRIEVRDSGPGLTASDLAQLFATHARLSNRPTGGESSTGVGLALCKRLVELHGGHITARNGNAGGAVFTVELPRA